MFKKTLHKTQQHFLAGSVAVLLACDADTAGSSSASGGSNSGGSTAAGSGGAAGASGAAAPGGATGSAGTAGLAGSAGKVGSESSESALACSAWAAILCQQQETCDQMAWIRAHGSTSACEQREDALCQKALKLPETHATSDQVADCTKTFQSPSCGQRCSALSPGQLLSGEPCAHSWQCASMRCTVTLAGGCGVCSGDRLAGASCKIDSECAEDFACFEGTCTARAPEGALCLDQPCALGLSCVGLSPLRVCKPQAALGEPCDPSNAGAADCAQGRCLDGVCKPVAIAQPGQPCSLTSSALCAGGFCDGSVCRGWAEEGDTCSTSLICGPGSVCIVPSKKCVLAPSCAL